MFEIRIVNLLDFLTFTFLILNSNLCLLAVSFLTLPSGSKSKVAGLVIVDKHVCRLLALRHLKDECDREHFFQYCNVAYLVTPWLKASG